MNERDELSEVIANFRDDWYKIDRKAPAGIDRDEAAHILAAGYRPPARTITTAEELDALGRGATVLDSLGDVWTHDGDPEDQWGSVTAKEDFGGPQWYGSSNIPLPVTVLYEPEPQP